MSDRLPNGQFPLGVSGNPGGRVKGRPSITKILRLLLDDDEATWAQARIVDAEGAVEGKGERLKAALNLLRRSKFDNAMTKELFDRVDGKLASVYTLPDDDDRTQVVRPVLYVAPDDPEDLKLLFRFSEDPPAEPEPEAGRQAPTPPPAREENKPSDAATRTERPERLVSVSEVGAPPPEAKDRK